MLWQRRGAGWIRETYTTEGVDPRKGAVAATRRRLVLQDNLAWGADYGKWIGEIIKNG